MLDIPASWAYDNRLLLLWWRERCHTLCFEKVIYLIGHTPSISPQSVHPSVCPSVCLSIRLSVHFVSKIHLKPSSARTPENFVRRIFGYYRNPKMNSLHYLVFGVRADPADYKLVSFNNRG